MRIFLSLVVLFFLPLPLAHGVSVHTDNGTYQKASAINNNEVSISVGISFPFQTSVNLGYAMGVDYKYRFNNGLGLGLNGLLMRNSSDDSKSIGVALIGPFFSSSPLVQIGNRHRATIRVGAGPLFYSSSDFSESQHKITKGHTFGFHVGYNYECRLSKRFSICFIGNGVSGSISKVIVSGNGTSQTINLDEDDCIKLCYLSASIGLCYLF